MAGPALICCVTIVSVMSRIVGFSLFTFTTWVCLFHFVFVPWIQRLFNFIVYRCIFHTEYQNGLIFKEFCRPYDFGVNKPAFTPLLFVYCSLKPCFVRGIFEFMLIIIINKAVLIFKSYTNMFALACFPIMQNLKPCRSHFNELVLVFGQNF